MSGSEPAAPGGRWNADWLRTSVNALTVIGLLAIILFVGIVAIMIVGLGFGGDSQPPRVAAKNEKIAFNVVGGQPLTGTNWIQMNVAASSNGSDPYGVSSSSRGQDLRNILLIDKSTGAARRILPDNQHRIADSNFLSAKTDLVQPGNDAELMAASATDAASAADQVAPIAYYLLRIEHPAEDGSAKTYDVLVGTLASARQGYVMRAIDGIDLIWMRSPTQIGLLVREKLALYFRVIDVPTLKVVESRRIEID